jgi:hypothetical protein
MTIVLEQAVAFPFGSKNLKLNYEHFNIKYRITTSCYYHL